MNTNLTTSPSKPSAIPEAFSNKLESVYNILQEWEVRFALYAHCLNDAHAAGAALERVAIQPFFAAPLDPDTHPRPSITASLEQSLAALETTFFSTFPRASGS